MHQDRELTFLLSNSQGIEPVPQHELALWRDHPLEQINEGQIIKDIMSRKNQGGVDFEGPWKRIRRDILTLPPGEPVIIGVVGRSGIGKSRIVQGLLQLLKHDLYMHKSAADAGVEDEGSFGQDGVRENGFL